MLSPEARKNTFIRIDYTGSDEEIEQTFNTLMGEDIASRKEFIRENIVNVDLNNLD